jgi:hypothetical protein
MAPKFNIRKTLAATVKEDNINLFPAVKIKLGRPKETTMGTPDEETKQTKTASAS